MQQELIEMLDKMVKYFDEIPADSYYYRETGAILNEAEKLVEKAKNGAKETAAPQGEPVGVVYSFPSGDGNTAWGFKPNDSAWEVEKQPKSYERRFNVYLQATPAAPSQEPVSLTDEQRQQVFRDAENRMMRDINLSWRNAVVDEVERAIAALREKEQAK